MRVGERMKCPHCSQDTVIKEKNLMDGWTAVGKILACAICGGKLGDIEAEPKAAANTAAMDSLKALLQTEGEAKPVIEVSEDEKHFCKDCAHFINHPFITRCGLHNRPTESMDDCPQFTQKVKA